MIPLESYTSSQSWWEPSKYPINLPIFKDFNISLKCLELALSQCDTDKIDNGQVYKMADDFYDYVTKPLPNGQTTTDWAQQGTANIY